MNEIHATQVKAARALLGLSQEELAAQTNLSVTTIRKIENGEISPRSTTMNAIRRTIEDAGWEFIHPEGIRRKQNDVTMFEGADGTDCFFDDLLETIKHKGGEVFGSLISQDMLMRSLGAHVKSNAERLTKLNELTQIKCLLSEPDDVPILLGSYQFRTVSRCYMSGIPYFVYGDKQALVVPEGKDDFRYIVLRSTSMTQRYRSRFLELWDVATPFMAFRKAERAYAR